MKQQRVSAAQLFELADRVVKLAGTAKSLSQYGVVEPLNAALAQVLDAAKSAAFNEAHEAHNMRTVPQSGGPHGE